MQDTGQSSSFEGLPLEVKTLVLKALDDPLDFHSLCLVSKSLQSLATPLLYQDFHYSFESAESSKSPEEIRKCFSALFERGGNPGIPHIRTISIINMPERETVDWEKASALVEKLLTCHVVPNSLRSMK